MGIERFTAQDSTEIWEHLNRLATDVEKLLPRRIVFSIPAGDWAAGGVRIFTVPFGETFERVPGVSLEFSGGPGGSGHLTARLGGDPSLAQCQVQVWNTDLSPRTVTVNLPLVLTVIPIP